MDDSIDQELTEKPVLPKDVVKQERVDKKDSPKEPELNMGIGSAVMEQRAMGQYGYP